MRFRTERMLQLGISENDVIGYLESITGGRFVTDWNRQDERIGIRLVGGTSRVYNPEEISMRIRNTEVPLSYLAAMERSSETEQLERVDQTPVLSYVADWSLADWWWKRDVTRESVRKCMSGSGQVALYGGRW